MFISSLTYVGQKITMHSELEIVIELVKFLIMHKVSIRIKIH